MNGDVWDYLAALSFLLLPLANFWCCCGPTCQLCDGQQRSRILLTFGGSWLSIFGPCPDCPNYVGSTYECLYIQTIPLANGGSNCVYEAPGECPDHLIRFEIQAQYSSPGVYFGTTVVVSVYWVGSGFPPSSGFIFIPAATETPFNCATVRNGTLNDGQGACFLTGGTWQMN